MITYQLALELKNAGFPQHGSGGLFVFNRFDTKKQKIPIFDTNFQLFMYMLGDDNLPEYVYCPTLSELIEACGDGFKGLLRHVVFGLDSAIRWECYHSDGSLYLTPEEAVARLWLTLNKK